MEPCHSYWSVFVKNMAIFGSISINSRLRVTCIIAQEINLSQAIFSRAIQDHQECHDIHQTIYTTQTLKTNITKIHKRHTFTIIPVKKESGKVKERIKLKENKIAQYEDSDEQ